MIKSAMGWPDAESDLIKSVSRIKDPLKRMEAQKMLRNFDPMITKLSKLELEARRSSSHSTRKVDEQLDIINQSMLGLEQWVTLLLLM